MGGVLLLTLLVAAAWLIFTGRLARMTGTDGVMLGLAIIGAALAARGNIWLGGAGLALALTYSWRRWGGGRRAASSGPPPPPPLADEAALTEARALLGVDAQADETEIRAAHRRLIARTHPDAGGTQALAEKINDARNILLRHLVESKRSQTPPQP